jgi:hypothetical protein
MDRSGDCYLILRYGNKAIAPTADKGAIAVGDKGKLVTVLEAVIAAVKSGELDAAIETVKGVERGVKRKAAQPHYAHQDVQRPSEPRSKGGVSLSRFRLTLETLRTPRFERQEAKTSFESRFQGVPIDQPASSPVDGWIADAFESVGVEFYDELALGAVAIGQQ